MSKRFNPDEIDREWTENELLAYVEARRHTKHGRCTMWVVDFEYWYKNGGREEMRTRPELPDGLVHGTIQTSMYLPMSVCVKMEQLMAEYGIPNRNELLRRLLRRERDGTPLWVPR